MKYWINLPKSKHKQRIAEKYNTPFRKRKVKVQHAMEEASKGESTTRHLGSE